MIQEYEQLRYIYENLNKADWLKQDAAKKMKFYQDNIASRRDDRPQIVEMLTSALLSAPSPAAPVIFSELRVEERDKKDRLDRKEPVEEAGIERKREIESNESLRNSPPVGKVPPQYLASQVKGLLPDEGDLSPSSQPLSQAREKRGKQ